jgi:hypothetical protein
VPGTHEKVFEKSESRCKKGLPKKFHQKRPQCSVPNQKPKPKVMKMLEFRLTFESCWNCIFLNPENLIIWPVKKVMRQVNGRLQTANKMALHRTIFELPEKN